MAYFDNGDEAMYHYLQARRGGAVQRRFDEYYRVYPTVMLPGADREYLNYGSKIIMPPSALDKLTKLHITYPMLFELVNGKVQTHTHAGVLEFIAEEGKAYLPQWMMNTLAMEIGDLVQIKSTDLLPATLVKLQPQDVSFLEITDPKAVLETAFRNFAALTQGDIFSFKYNDQVYDVAVLEVKPKSEKLGVGMLETDVSVDFAAPLGYVEPERVSGTSTPRGAAGVPAGGLLHHQGTMAQAINYDAIAPSSNAVVAGQKAVSSNFLTGGHKLSSKKGSKVATPKPSTPVAGASSNTQPPPTARRTNGPQPLRLGPNKLFFGYEIKPVKTKEEKEREVAEGQRVVHFQGQGQTLKGGKAKPRDDKMEDVQVDKKSDLQGTGAGGQRLDGKGTKR